MEHKKIEDFKKQALKALFSDKDFAGLFVLKGGSAIDLVFLYPSGRSSIDIDLSMPSDFTDNELQSFENRVRVLLRSFFRKQGFETIDCSLSPRPSVRQSDLPDFWKGYRLEFKLVAADKFNTHKNDMQSLRRHAEIIGPSSKVKIDISSHEYCEYKIPVDLEGSTIYVYSPEMLVAEKLRAICQQMPDYPHIGEHAKRPRARDFYDIHLIMEHETGVYWEGPGFSEIVKKTFEAKSVPLRLLAFIQKDDTRAFHTSDFEAVRSTVSPESGEILMDFDFYFESIVQFVFRLKALWEK